MEGHLAHWMESHNIEYKESWHDEYLKWICGYANAEGGTLYIGMNDMGKVVGLANAVQLLETIPNKVRDILGIMVAVNLGESKDGDFLEIIVDPYPSPVSYKGQYHYRSGSTKQELKGAALDRFLLRKQGRTWDSVPVPGVGTKDLSSEAVRQFRDLAKEGRRMDAASIKASVNGMVEKLNLTDGKYLKRGRPSSSSIRIPKSSSPGRLSKSVISERKPKSPITMKCTAVSLRKSTRPWICFKPST